MKNLNKIYEKEEIELQQRREYLEHISWEIFQYLPDNVEREYLDYMLTEVLEKQVKEVFNYTMSMGLTIAEQIAADIMYIFNEYNNHPDGKFQYLAEELGDERIEEIRQEMIEEILAEEWDNERI